MQVFQLLPSSGISSLQPGYLASEALDVTGDAQLRVVLLLVPEEGRKKDDAGICRLTLTLNASDANDGEAVVVHPKLAVQAESNENHALDDLVHALTHLVQKVPSDAAAATRPPASPALPQNGKDVQVSEEIMAGGLSPREIEVLKAVQKGDSNKQIARKLNIAEPTVKCHVKSILRKLHARNRFEAAMWAMRLQLHAET